MEFTDFSELWPEEAEPSLWNRLLEDTEDEDEDSASDSQKIRDTFTVYGSLFIVLFLIFCYARRKYPRMFTIRNWVEKHKTYLAADQYGFFNWVPHMFYVTEDELLDEIGMDSLCFTRILQLGYKTALVGVFNAIWLMPLYHYAETRSDTATITDKIVETTIGHVPEGSRKLVGTAIASWFLFGYLMYLMLQEFEWFTEKRHKYLQKPVPENYTVFVRNIPPEYRSSKALARFFESCFAGKDVYQASIMIQTANLAKQVTARTAAVANLEHAVLYHEIKGVRPTHKPGLVGAVNITQENVDSIEYYANEVKTLNDDIAERISKIDEGQASGDRPPVAHVDTSDGQGLDESSIIGPPSPERTPSARAKLLQPVQGLSSGVANLTQNVASEGLALMKAVEDGEVLQSGFVTFSKIAITNAALQMVHHGTPFCMEVAEAPAPDDIFWPNVNRSHKDLQVGKLLSITITTTLCLLWTIPMGFFASLSSVDALRDQFDFIDDLLDKAPFLVPVFQQLAPLLVVAVNSMLPIILEYVTLLEGPVSGSVVEAGLYTKLAAFSVIQTFFVVSISGGIMEELANLIEDPTSIIGFLATSLPSQSTFFMQLSFVDLVVTDALAEAFRLYPLLLAIGRSFFGPNLNQKERETSIFGGLLRPFADPLEFEHAQVLSTVVLLFMVTMVYCSIAPLIAFVVAFCFLYKSVLYRHQFIYIYPTSPDSGGKMWISFMRNLTTLMLIAEVTIAGLLGLKQATIGTPLMAPLIIVTFLFKQYVAQQHFHVPMHLPTRECVKLDDMNGPDFEPTFAKDKYVQPELRDPIAVPNIDEELIEKYGLQVPEPEIEEGDIFADSVQEEKQDNQSLAGTILSALSFGKPNKR